MKTRIVVMGNCQAQYLAASLSYHFPEIDVIVVGKPFDGPINYRDTIPSYINADSIVEWMKLDDENLLILKQVTPHFNTNFEDKLNHLGVNFDVLLFPYIEFRSLQLRFDDIVNDDSVLKVSVRADEIQNTMCLRKANINSDVYTDLLDHLSNHPCAYTKNHFDGFLFSKIFDSSNLNKLKQSVGSEKFNFWINSVSSDVGISHQHSGIPINEVCDKINIKWSKSVYDIAHTAYIRTLENNAVSKHILKQMKNFSYCSHILWRLLLRDAKRNENSALLCGQLFEVGGRHVNWARSLANHYLSVDRISEASNIIIKRMMLDDTRGLLLRFVLDNLAIFQSSSLSKDLFESAAKAYPQSNCKIVRDVLFALN